MSRDPRPVQLDDVLDRPAGAQLTVVRLDDGTRVLAADAATRSAPHELVELPGDTGLAVVYVLRGDRS